jgi:hypothetical protein
MTVKIEVMLRNKTTQIRQKEREEIALNCFRCGRKKVSPRHMPYCKECFSFYWDPKGEWNQPIRKEEEIPN